MNANNKIVVSSNNQSSEFSGEQIKAKILATVGKDTPEEVLSMLLTDEEMVASAVAVLRKEQETKLVTALSDAKKKMANVLSGTTTVKQTGDDKDTRISRMTQYQQNTFGVLSPSFVYNNVDMAGSWRRYLICFIIGLRNLMKVVDKTSAYGVQLVSQADSLQKHIDAADAVLEGFYKVSADYRTQADLRKQVEMEMFMNSEYQEYQDLVQDVSTTIDSFREKYTVSHSVDVVDEGGQPQQTKPSVKKGKKNAHQPQD